MSEGEGQTRNRLIHSAFPRSSIIGLVLIAIGIALIGIALLFGIGRDDGGPFFVMGCILSVALGFAFFLWGFLRELVSRRGR
jgi:hypothetical protein